MVEADRIKKGFLLYLFLVPLFLSVVVALFKMQFTTFLIDGVAFLLLFAVLWLSKKGFAQEINYQKAKLAKAPGIRYKEYAAYLLGITTFYSAYVAGAKPLIESLFLSVIAIGGYWLYYGFDPKEDKLEDYGDISAEIVLETLNEAYRKLAGIEKENDKITDRTVHNKVELALERAHTILDAIAEDPKDLRSARKFLVVYIDGVANVTSSYNALDGEIDVQTRERLLHLMEDVERRFQKELQRLKANNQFDLDVHIDVLQEQIRH